MPFTIDEDSLLIRGRKGDSASLNLNFNQDLSGYTIYFYIQKNINSSEAIIEKIYTNQTGPIFTVKLTAEDTNKLSSGQSYGTYYWGIKIKNENALVKTLIPEDFKNPPKMYIYPEIGGN